jgi:pyruvate/2-oxoglutarate dehydrogenase complex dihydrolipoamide acyltransferase (E2) component
MSFFSKILDKLGLAKDKDKAAASTPAAVQAPAPAAAPPKPAAPAPAPKPAMSQPASPAPASTVSRAEKDDMIQHGPAGVAPAAPKPMEQVDVMHMLEQKAKGTGLNWKQSISDLLFLLEIDNSREARTELAKELACPPELMSDSAKMNTWLHKTVLRKIAENGGNIPQELLD